MPVTDEHIDDLLLRFATLARELGSQLPPPSAPQRLLHELAKVLRELPKADANSHRYALWREIEARVLQVVTPLLEAADAAGEGPEHEEQIYQRCLQHPGFRKLQQALVEELSAACSTLDVARADKVAAALEDGRAESGSNSTDGGGSFDNFLDELGELPPFLELPGILEELAASSSGAGASSSSASPGAWLDA